MGDISTITYRGLGAIMSHTTGGWKRIREDDPRDLKKFTALRTTDWRKAIVEGDKMTKDEKNRLMHEFIRNYNKTRRIELNKKL